MPQWNEIFRDKGKFFTEIREEIPDVSRLFKKQGVKRILDLGCGSGRHTVYFAKKGFDVYGFDISKEGIKLTKAWLKKENVTANLKIGSIYQRLPYQDNFFDALICTQVIHHNKIKNIRKAIAEIERVLKSHGLLFVTVSRGRRKDYRQIASRTYINTEGHESGVIHYVFNKNLLRKEFRSFKIYKIEVDSRKSQYCLLGESKKKV